VPVRLFPFVLLSALALLFFADLLMHPDQVLYSDHSDLLAMHLPMKRFLVRSWHETGELPVWNPYSFGGMPFLADVQVAAFYPPHVVLYFLNEEQVGPALSWLVVAHVILAGWAMYLYARRQQLDRLPALIAAIGFMFAGKWLMHILAAGHYIMVPLAWLPLVLLFLERAIRRGSVLSAVLAGVFYAFIILGTHPQMTLYAGVFIALWTLGTALWSRQGDNETPRSARKALLTWAFLGALAAVTAIALSAVQLVPALNAAREATRGVGVAPSEILKGTVPTLLSLIGPPVLPTGWWEAQGGLGILWLATAVLAPVLLGGLVRYRAFVALLLLLFALGGAAVFQWLPGFKLFILPGRMLMLAALPVALLAGTATHELIQNSARMSAVRGLWLAVALAATVIYGGVALWLHNTHGGGDYWFPLCVTLPAMFVLLCRPSGVGRRRWQALWLCVLLVDAWTLTHWLVAVRSQADVYPISPSVQFLIDRQKELHAKGERMRVLARGLPGDPAGTPLGSGLSMIGGVELESVLGYNSFDVRRYKEYLQFIEDSDDPIEPRVGIYGYPIVDLTLRDRPFVIRNKSLLDLLNVRYLIQPSNLAPPLQRKLDAGPGEPTHEGSGWRKVMEDTRAEAYSFTNHGIEALPAFTVYENLDVLPRAFCVPSVKVRTNGAPPLPALRSVDFRKAALLESSAGPIDPTKIGGEPRAARIKEYAPNRVVLEISPTAADQFLVLCDPWSKQWSVTVDGQVSEVQRSSFLFRAVRVPAGAREVIFRATVMSNEVTGP
jgi:hypothetical protein